MHISRWILEKARTLPPGSFALVMATGIVSVDVRQYGMLWLAQGMFWLNWVAYLCLLLLTALRCARYRAEVMQHFVSPGDSATFLTFAAGTCVLAAQCLQVVHLPQVARAMAAWGALAWAGLIYGFFFVVITRHVKASFSHTIHGSWLVVVVATQALAVVVALLARDGTLVVREELLFVGICLYLIGCAWYLVLITFITYRMVLLRFNPAEFTPPYWINMGAVAISTLAGSLMIMNAPPVGPLHDLLPFIKGFTLFYWASGTWWIPLLILLEAWRHLYGRIPFRYEVDAWNVVFPIGMYTACTAALARATGAHYLYVISDGGVYVSLAVWAVVAFGLLRRIVAGDLIPALRACCL